MGVQASRTERGNEQPSDVPSRVLVRTARILTGIENPAALSF
jgi:hypothetical protein